MYPLLARLHQRSRVEVRVLAKPSHVRRNSRFALTFEQLGLVPKSAGFLRMRFFYKFDIGGCDAFLTMADPLHDESSRGRRSEYLAKIGKPTVFMQHGALQVNVNYPNSGQRLDYHSILVLLWQKGLFEEKVLSDSVLHRSRQVGFTKTRVQSPLPLAREVQEWRQCHSHSLLICHSFRWGGGRHGANELARFHESLDVLLSSRRELGVLLRPHRGRGRGEPANLATILEQRHPNLIVSREREGPLKGASIHDCIELCDGVVAPASTVVLDAAYAGKPVALFEDPHRFFPELPTLQSVDELSAFASDPMAHLAAAEAVRRRYGDVHDNIEAAAEAVEDALVGIRTAAAGCRR